MLKGFSFEDCVPKCSGPAFEAYQAAAACFWLPSKLCKLNKDRASYEALSPAKRTLLRTMLAFFLPADKLVIDNIAEMLRQQLRAEDFLPALDMEGVIDFLNFQTVMEKIHAITYKSLWEGIIPPNERREIDFESMPGVLRKLESMRRYAAPDVPLAERLFVWYLAEGLFFQETFGGIFYFPEGEFPGLWQSNKLISRDENLHTLFGALLLLHLRTPLSQEKAHSIARSFVETSEAFCRDALPQPIFGLSAEKLATYAMYRCDVLLKMVDFAPIFGKANPLKYMEETGLDEAFNFFEIHPSYDHGGNALTASGGNESQDCSGDEKSATPALVDDYFAEAD